MATILVVDDHPINRAFLVTLLSYGKHRLLEAPDGVEGLKLVKAERPDLVVTDIFMPHMDGHEFVTRIHAIPELAATPVIFYTAGYHEAEARVIARSCGVSQVLAKPAEPEAILRAVNEALGITAPITNVPGLTAPPAEGSRFSTIDSQMAEYLVELENSSNLIAQMVAQPELTEANAVERSAAQKRLAASLSQLQAASVRLTALVEISREVAAESATAGESDLTDLAYGTDFVRPGRTIAETLRTGPGPGKRKQAGTAADNVDAAAASSGSVEKVAVSHERARFQARLAKALQFAGYPHDSPTQLAREFNFRFSGRPVTIHAARKWLVGESIPTQDKLRILAKWLGVTAEWLRFGDAENAPPGGKPQRPASPANSEESKLLAELLNLDPYHRRLAHDFVSMLAAQHAKQETTKGTGNNRPRMVDAKLK